MKKSCTLTILLALALSGCESMNSEADSAAQAELATQMSFDGLSLRQQEAFDDVFVAEQLDMSEYDSIMFEAGNVAFKEDWKRNYNSGNRINRVTDRDMQEIRERMSRLVFEEFEKVVSEKSRFKVVSEASASTLLIKPSIINLDVNSPDLRTATRQYTYSESAGEATLYLEIFDSLSGQVLARIIDRQEDRDDAYFSWRTRASNAQDTKMAARSWAERLAELMDKVPE